MRTLTLLCSAGHCVATQWVVIVAGSTGYPNYRHQADACHAYQIVKSNGISEEHIILMAYDDIARDGQNPFAGQLFNHPAPNSTGRDVYAECSIDYKGKDVTADVFLGVLNGTGSGKVLKSTKDDNIFLFYTGHSAIGIIPFPDNSLLFSMQFQATLQHMHDSEMFKNMVCYLEGGEVGSMFDGMRTPNIYGVTAGNGRESSYATYCPPDDVVSGKSVGVCLGDLFSVAWMEDVDTNGTVGVSLQEQYERVKQRTSNSHVTQWGDLSFTGVLVSEFLGAGFGHVDAREFSSEASVSLQTNSYRIPVETVQGISV